VSALIPKRYSLQYFVHSRFDEPCAARTCLNEYQAIRGDPDPTSTGTAGDAARWGGSIAVAEKAANPL
jgi:hypothetical protein